MMRFRETIENHPLVVLTIVVAIVVGTTWVVAREILVSPRDFQIEVLRQEVEDLKETIDLQKPRTTRSDAGQGKGADAPAEPLSDKDLASRSMVLSGHPVTSKLIDHKGSVADYPNNGTTEHYDNPILTIRGERATFEATYIARREDQVEVRGRIIAEGRFQDGQAYLTYKITDPERSQEWSGVLMLYVPGMGDLTGYYLVESSLYPGHTALGHVKLKRIRAIDT